MRAERQTLRLECAWPAPQTARSQSGWSGGWARRGAQRDKGSGGPVRSELFWVISRPLEHFRYRGPGPDFHVKIISVAVPSREAWRRPGRKWGSVRRLTQGSNKVAQIQVVSSGCT